ncbi:twin-arginine translocation signal domain-containing protein [Denitromonas iodatirespirans]|nr:twin-arginine translocation signal domain-containing protein [Denitromonas iodatirespirans]
MKDDQLQSAAAQGMRVVEKRVAVSRRAFLKGSGLAAAGVTALSAGSLMLPARDALAAEFTHLGADIGKTLLVMARDIFPHDKISDRFYMLAIEPYDAAAAKDPALAKLISDGVAQLNALAQANFMAPYAEVPTETERLTLLYTIEHGAFFQKIKGDMVTGFYNNKAVWPLFGEEGSSWEKGGYIARGFDDIDWLPKA